MLTLDTARACAASLALARGAKILDPDEARPYLETLATAVSLVPGAAPIVAAVRGLLSGAADAVAGLALPTPWGTLVLLSPRALVDGPTLLSVVAHELVHDAQARAVGAGQVAVDYLHPELRAHREGEAGGVGLWARYLVTGERPSPSDAGVATSALYHLDAAHKAFGRAVVASALASIPDGAVPPHSVARDLLAWLREHAPEAIVAEEYKARATEVPS